MPPMPGQTGGFNPSGQTPDFKSQPWFLFDSIVAYSYLLGDTSANGLARGSAIPAVSGAGEMIFFQSQGRTTATMPWYTNIDQPGQLAYGFEVWQMYLIFAFPIAPLSNSYDFDAPVTAPTLLNVPMPVRLLECLVNYSVLELNLGQENQTIWPVARFGAGGGVSLNATAVASGQNSDQQGANVLKLPEPISMPRTQVLNAKIRISTDVHSLIGTVAVPGVGAPLATQDYVVANADTNALVLAPYKTEFGLVGRRIKDVQYGQLPGQ